MRVLACNVLLTAIVASSLVRGQVALEESTRHPMWVDSGVVRNDSNVAASHGLPAVVWARLVAIQGASWLRLEYRGVLLAGAADRGRDGSFLRITSLFDGSHQTQHRRHVGEWRDTSAYFNGDAVLVELLAFPGTGDNRWILGSVNAGPAAGAGTDTICGPIDNRILSNDPRVARLQPQGCTSWLIDDCNHCLLTAGHCGGQQVVEFNVPLSIGGVIQHPGPQDQYAIDAGSERLGGLGAIGDDWGYFGVFANSVTGLFPHEANGHQFFHVQAPLPAITTQFVRVTGYGGGPTSAWEQVQKTHAGPFVSLVGTTLSYTVDTTGGNSGSPIVLDATDQALGIHTHGGCTAMGGANHGTATTNAGLQAALASPLGVCLPVGLGFAHPLGLPSHVAPNGSSTIRVRVDPATSLLAGTVRFHVSTGGAFQTLTPIALTPNVFEAQVPASQCGTELQYYWTAQHQGGPTYADPATAPAAVHTVRAADTITTVRHHDFETAPPAWTVVNTGVLAGGWVRDVPTGSGGPTSDHDGSGRCWVTGNQNGEDVDGGPTRLVTETVDVSAFANPVVSYSLWFTDVPGDDLLLVEASNNGGTMIIVENLQAFAGWQRHGFRVRDHFAAPGQLVVHFTVADRPDNSIAEAAVDAFRIDDVTCTPASWTPYGNGCAASGTQPALVLVSAPALGGVFTLDVQNLASGLGLMLVGFDPLAVALPSPPFAAGCSLQVAPLMTNVLVTTTGTATWSLAIPSTLTLPGTQLHVQALDLRPAWALSQAGFGEIR